MINVYEQLGYAVITQAVKDFKVLRRAGVIVDGECIKVWPMWKGKPLVVSAHFRKKHSVVALVHWFKCGHLERMLDLVGSDMDAATIMRGLGITLTEPMEKG